jgi:hypothetical protein
VNAPTTTATTAISSQREHALRELELSRCE